MVWQDLVIGVANLVFVYSLSYQVYYGFKRKKGLLTLQTSGLNFLSLFIISIAFFTLNLYFSFIAILIGSILWLILFIQRLIYDKV